MVAIPAVAPTRLHGDAKTKSAIPKDLYRFIYALSGACERDANVLRDGRLVDTLESQAKEIIRARRQHRSPSMGSNYSSSSLSSSSSSMRAGTPPPPPPPPPSSSSKLSKRRKLPTDKPTSVVSSSPPSNNSHIDDAASLVMARGDGSSSVIPAVKISKLERPRTLVSSSPSRSKSVDLAGSMASTVSSSSMRQYDLDADDATTLTPTARYARASSTYDYDDYPPPPRSRMSSLRRQSNNSVDDHQPSTPSTDLDDSLLHVDELRTSLRKDSCYSESSTSSSSFDRVTPKKLRFEMDALSLYEKDDDTLHLSTGSSIKNVESSLVETLQSQVDLLLSENVKALAENARLLEATQMSVCELEGHVEEKRRVLQQVHQQSLQLAEIQHKLEETESRANAQSDIRREAEVAFQAELDAKTKLLTSLQEQMEAKEDEIGRLTKRVEEISGVFASKMRERESLSRSSITSSAQVIDLDEGKLEVGDEPESVRALRENNVCMDLELQKMRATLLEKDREICNLYMHLSTKKKLIEEITKKFVQHMEEAAAVAKANAAASTESAVATESVVTTSEGSETTFAKDGVRFDLDMFLFKNVVDKQRRVEELTAALGVMDREVESLESRVAEKELENTQLREKQDFLTRSLQSVNAQVVRVRTENEQLVSLNEEKQTRITGLVASLEEKERQILHLDEQIDLRQTQIDHLMEKASNSGRKSLKNSLFKPRASLGSSSVKNAPSRGSLMSFSSSRDEEDENVLRSSMMSAARVSITRKPSADSGDVRSSMDWTDVRRSSLLSSQRASVSAEKENRASLVSDSEFAPKRSSLFSRVFDDISSPINDDDDTDSFFNLNPSSPSEPRSTRASYCASEINDDEELYNELFAKA